MNTKKLLSVFLSVVMLLGMLPTAAFADNTPADPAGGSGVAEGESIEETTLQDQFDAATGADTVIQLTGNVDASVTNTNKHATQIVVDLNGYTWSSAEAFTLKNDGCKIVLKDTSEAGTGALTNSNTTQGQAVWARTGDVHIEGGTYTNNSAYEATIYVGTSQAGGENARLTITGGTFKNNAEGQYANINVLKPLVLNVHNDCNSENLKLEGGTFYGNDPRYDDKADPLCKELEGYDAARLFAIDDGLTVSEVTTGKWVVYEKINAEIEKVNISAANFDNTGSDGYKIATKDPNTEDEEDASYGTDQVLEISMKRLKQWTPVGKSEGYWTGFGVVASDKVKSAKVASAATVEALKEAELAAAELDTLNNQKTGVPIFVDAKASTTRYYRVVLYGSEGEALYDKMFFVDVKGVELVTELTAASATLTDFATKGATADIDTTSSHTESQTFAVYTDENGTTPATGWSAAYKGANAITLTYSASAPELTKASYTLYITAKNADDEPQGNVGSWAESVTLEVTVSTAQSALTVSGNTAKFDNSEGKSAAFTITELANDTDLVVYEAVDATTPSASYTATAEGTNMTISSAKKPNAAVSLWVAAKTAGKRESERVAITLNADALETPTVSAPAVVKVKDDAGTTDIVVTVTNEAQKRGTFYDVYKSETLTKENRLAEDLELTGDGSNELAFTVEDSAYTANALSVYLVAKKTGSADSAPSSAVSVNRTATGVTVADNTVNVAAADNTNKTGTATITAATNDATTTYKVYANEADTAVVEGVTLTYASETTLTFTSTAAISTETTYYIVARTTDKAPVRFTLTYTPKSAATAPAFDTSTPLTGETSGTVSVFLTNAYRTGKFAEEGITNHSGFTIYASDEATSAVAETVAEFTAYNEGTLTLTLGANAFDDGTTLDLWVSAKSTSYAESPRTQITVTQVQSAALTLGEQADGDLKFISADDVNFTVTLSEAPASGTLKLYDAAGQAVETEPISANGTVVTVTFKTAANALTGGTWTLANTETNKAESNKLTLEVTKYTKSSEAALTGIAVKSGASYSTSTAATAPEEGTKTYTITVDTDVTSIKVAATLTGTSAYVIVNDGEPIATTVESAVINLPNVGETTNDVTIKLYAEDGTLVDTYTLAVTRTAAGSDIAAELKSITVNTGSLDHVFDKDTLSYTVTGLTASTASVIVTAVKSDDDSSPVITMGTDENALATKADNQLTVTFDKAGTKTVYIKVVSSSGATQTYSVEMTRPASADADLAAATPVKLYPNSDYSSNPETVSGNANDGFTVAATNRGAQTLYLAVEVKDDNATVTFDGSDPDSNDGKVFKKAVNVNDGVTTISFTVHAEDGTEETYTLAVTVTPKNTDATLSALQILTGSGYSAANLSPSFDANTTSYTAAAISTGDQSYGFKVTATANDTGVATVAVSVEDAKGNSIADQVGVYKITPDGEVTTAKVKILVTAEDGTTTRTYTVTVTQEGKKNIATLGALSVATYNAASDATVVSASKLNFSATKTDYALSVASDVASVKITPTVTENSSATVKVKGTSVVSGEQSDAINLKTGANVIEIVVTAEDNSTTETYTLTVNKAAASTDAGLASVTAGGKAVDIPANSTELSLESITVSGDNYAVSAVAKDSKAKVSIDDAVGSDDKSSETKNDISTGTKNVSIYVQAESGDVTVYTLSIDTITTAGDDYTGESAVAAAAATTASTEADGTVVATTTVDTSVADNIGTGTTTVTVTATGTDADVTNVALPATVVTALADSASSEEAADGASVTVETDVADVTLSNEALQTIATAANADGKAGTASIDVAKPVWSDPAKPKVVAAVAAAIAENAENSGSLASSTIEAFSVEVTDSSGAEIEIKELENPISLTFKTSLSNPVIFYVDTRGSIAVLRKVANQIASGGSVTFDSKHLSDYVAFEEGEIASIATYSDGLAVPSTSTSGGLTTFTVDGYALDSYITVQTQTSGGYSSVTFSGMGPSIQINAASGATISVWETAADVTFTANGAVSGDYIDTATAG